MRDSVRTALRTGGAVLFWLLLIFTTSCYVIFADPFVRFVQGLSPNIGFQQWFSQFWRDDGFFVVKGWHATEYAILTVLATSALGRWKPRWSYRRRLGMAFAFAVLFAASDEWHQTFVPGRDGCLRDVGIDTGGALLAALSLSVRHRRVLSITPDNLP